MDHWERIDSAMRGQPVDRPPLALWKHSPADDQEVRKLARHSVEWQRKWDFDLVKLMPSGTHSAEAWGAVSAYDGAANGARIIIEPAVRRTEDWASIKPVSTKRGHFFLQNEALAETVRQLRGSVPILQTVFSPLTTARKMSSDALYADLRRHPDMVEQALMAITETTIDYALDAMKAGAHGIFFATQQATHRLLTAAEFERFGRKYDLMVLEALNGQASHNMLHAHGEDLMVDLLASYPVQMFNWHDRLTYPNIKQAQDLFPGLLVGGLNENHTLVHGSDEDIALEVQSALEAAQSGRLMIAPGCVLPIATPERAIVAVQSAVRDRQASPVY